MKELSQRDGLVEMNEYIRDSDTLAALFCNIQGSIRRDRDNLQDLVVEYAITESDFKMVSECIWAYTVAKRNYEEFDNEDADFINPSCLLPSSIDRYINEIKDYFRYCHSVDHHDTSACLNTYRKNLEQQLVDLEELQDSTIDTIELKIDQLIELNNLASKGN